MVAAQVAADKLAPAAAQEQVQDVHSDPRWAGIKWTIYRGIAYDITSFIPRHPGGEWLVNLAVGRDCTALFESYHLRHDIALQAFGKLPQLADFPVHAVARAPYPGDSKLYSGRGTPLSRKVLLMKAGCSMCHHQQRTVALGAHLVKTLRAVEVQLLCACLWSVLVVLMVLSLLAFRAGQLLMIHQ